MQFVTFVTILIKRHHKKHQRCWPPIATDVAVAWSGRLSHS